MEIIIQKSYEEISKSAAEVVAEVVNNKPDAVLGLATGSTPLGLYPEYFREERDPIGAHLCVNAPKPKDGWISPPERPGFGLEFDEDYIKKYRVQ